MSLSSFFTSAKNQELYSSNHERDIAFMERFWRCNSLLHFLAYRILGTHEGAGNAVENCRIVPRGIRRVSSTKAPSVVGSRES